MAGFFVQTVESVVGPLSEVEMREAALANIIANDAAIGNGLEGPWNAASDIGFFNEKGVAKPHPRDVVVPEFDVQGMPGTFQGPFKLRELIGFAARGMLPADAQLRFVNPNAESENNWKPVSSVRILAETFSGRLVKVTDSGRLVLLSSSNQDPLPNDARAPIEIAPDVDHRDRTAYVAPVREVDPAFEAEQAALAEQARQAAEEKKASAKVAKPKREEKKTKSRTTSSANANSAPADSLRGTMNRFAHRAVVPLLLLLVVVAGFHAWNIAPECGHVAGKVTIGGKVIAQGSIIFEDKASGVSVGAVLGSDGSYLVKTYDLGGLPPGTYKVAVTASTFGTGEAPLVAASNTQLAAPVSEIPQKYHSTATSQLIATVKDGDNEPYNFDLVP